MPTGKPGGARKRAAKKVAAVKHGKQSRPNIPTAEMEGLVAEKENQPLAVEYPRNRDLDPQLCWTGKDEENAAQKLPIDAVPIYVQEKIHPQVIIEDLRRQTAHRRHQQPGSMGDLFASDFNGLPDDDSRVEFYQHRHKWTNRMILGNSLRVMASLAHKEGLKGKVQCIYMDPPYGIKFASNWQTSTKSTEVKDGDETREPEMIQAFRDTWRLGIHSYLSYLRNRLTVARDLLTESGSLFLQMGDENVHLAAALMDEVFGADNRIATISFATTSGSSTAHLPQVADYLLWYAKNKEQVKYRQLYEELSRKEIIDFFNWHVHLELHSGITRKLTEQEQYAPDRHIPKNARIFKRVALGSQGASTTGRSEPYTWCNRVYPCAQNSQWPVSTEGMDRLGKAGRLHANKGQDSLMWKRYEEEVPGRRINNLWNTQMYPSDKRYVVQTANKVIQRCILMTTDPGDLVLDPTCGSGTAATVAEQWGRRWITIDTSRVALTIARARLMGGKYDYYLMQDSEDGAKQEAELNNQPFAKKQYTNDVQHGFVYHRVNTISPKLIAYNNEIDIIWDKWREKILPLQEAFNAAIGKPHEEWEIPLEAPQDADWSNEVKKAHAAWLAARKQRQQEMDASIAANAKTELLVDRPYTAANTVRVTGPFTMESLSPHRILPTDSSDEALLAAADAEAVQQGEAPPKRESKRLRPKSETENETDFIQIIHDNLKTAGIQNTRKNERLEFTHIEPWQGGRESYIQFVGHYEEDGKLKKAAICIGPEYGTVTRSLLVAAARQAADMSDMLIIMGFAYEAHADDKMTNVGKLPVLRVRLNSDLHMGDRLQTSRNGNLFVVFGEPDIALRGADENGLWEVEIKGVDIFDPTTGEVKASDTKDIACWMIDTDYNEESFFARHVYFTGGGKDPYQQLKANLNAEIDKEEWQTLYSAVSRPFATPQTGKIAVKAINHYGDEVIKVFEVQNEQQQ